MTPSLHLQQRGLGMLGFLFLLSVCGLAAALGLKLLPAYMEYYSIQTTVARIAQDPMMQTERDMRVAFDRQMQVDNIHTVSGRDLSISGQHLSLAYQKTVPLTETMTLQIDFVAENTP